METFVAISFFIGLVALLVSIIMFIVKKIEKENTERIAKTINFVVFVIALDIIIMLFPMGKTTALVYTGILLLISIHYVISLDVLRLNIISRKDSSIGENVPVTLNQTTNNQQIQEITAKTVSADEEVTILPESADAEYIENIEEDNDQKPISDNELNEFRLISDVEVQNTQEGVRINFGREENSVSEEFPSVARECKSSFEVPIFRFGASYFKQDISKNNSLIGGTSGSGKSSLAKALLMWLCLRNSPENLRVVIIDTRSVDYISFRSLPHLLVPVVKEINRAPGLIRWLNTEVINRNRSMQSGINVASQKILLVIDDMAGLGDPSDWKESLRNILAEGQRVGVFVMMVTSNPSSDVLSTDLKINIPLRMSFYVPSTMGSRMILEASGAEKISERGNVLVNASGSIKEGKALYIAEEDLETLSRQLNDIYGEHYYECLSYSTSLLQDNWPIHCIHNPDEEIVKKINYNSGAVSPDDTDENGFDDMFEAAVEAVLDAGQANTSMIMRKLRLGYARCARIMDEMEQAGIIAPQEGSKPRQVLITKQQWRERTTVRR